MGFEALAVCEQCDLISQETVLAPGDKALCGRCGTVLYRSQPRGLELSLIFCITSAVLFLISNSFLIVTISTQGLSNSTTLLEAAYRLVDDGIPSIACLVFATTFLMPALQILAVMYLLLPLRFGRLPPGFSYAYRVIYFVKPWAMIEVFMLGLLVTITKLNAFASVEPDIGLATFLLLMISMTAAAANFDDRAFWRQVAKVKSAQVTAC